MHFNYYELLGGGVAVVLRRDHIEPGPFSYGFASLSFKLEMLLVPVWLPQINRGIFLLNSYSNLCGRDFSEFLDIIKVIVTAANQQGIWIIGMEDANFSPNNQNHYNNTGAQQFVHQVCSLGVRFLHDLNVGTHGINAISHIWTTITDSSAAATSSIIKQPDNRDNHDVLVVNLDFHLQNVDNGSQGSRAFHQKSINIIRGLERKMREIGSCALFRRIGEKWAATPFPTGFVASILPGEISAARQEPRKTLREITEKFRIPSYHNANILENIDNVSLPLEMVHPGNMFCARFSRQTKRQSLVSQ